MGATLGPCHAYYQLFNAHLNVEQQKINPYQGKQLLINEPRREGALSMKAG